MSFASVSIGLFLIALISLIVYTPAVWFFNILGLMLAVIGKAAEIAHPTTGLSLSGLAIRSHAGLFILILFIVVFY